MTASQPVRTLIVDDSALVRKLLTHLLDSHPRISVVGTAIDAQDARAKIKQLNPDVLTLDIEMPGMDGLNFLGKIMTLRPMPVIMVSTLTSKGADASLEAMRLGAFDVFPKPRTNLSRELDSYRGELQEKVLAAAHANVRVLADRAKRHLGQTQTTRVLEDAPIAANSALQPLVAIGASTGGTEAIALCMERLPANMPGIVITQHIPGAFSESFARRLNDCSALNVTEARHGDRILAGHAYVAPGDQHLEVIRDGAHFVCRLNQGEPVNRHRPSVDVMFDSVARCARNLVVGVLLTGMGKDGAQGLLDIRQAGGRTIAQDEESSVVWGMPGSAVKLGAAESIMPIDHVAPQILTCLRSLA
ncbi:MAG: chemotaxis response regulator protein-glutamate methylesterase [Pseudomonadales bacterium]